MTIVANSKSLAKLGKFINNRIHRQLFGTHLLITNALISTGMGTLGDFMQQNFSNLSTKLKKEKDGEEVKFNYVRSAHMSAAGLTTGCLTHYWYIYLDKFLGKERRNLKLVFKKVLVDQIVFSPVNLACYFLTIGLLERSSFKYIFDEFNQKGMQNIYLVEWSIWPLAQWINFYLLPVQYRILFDNVISLFFDVYSPYVKYKTELKGQLKNEDLKGKDSKE